MIKLIPVLLVLFGSLIGASGTLIIKKGTNKFSFFQLLKSKNLWMGLLLYCVSMIVYVLALSQERLSVIYPIASTAYIWTTLFSVKFLGEKMNPWKWLALSGIIVGVTLIGLGS
ncbi:MAG TPA: EamA family transporter [Candidatus Nanoarchaeia archaeon]|nr:EamA family transporter [Candidatus Nanoarchaeia archaeon]